MIGGFAFSFASRFLLPLLLLLLLLHSLKITITMITSGILQQQRERLPRNGKQFGQLEEEEEDSKEGRMREEADGLRHVILSCYYYACPVASRMA